MSRSYSLTSLALAVAGGFIALTTFAFSQGSSNSITFAIAIAAGLAAIAAQRRVPDVHRRLHRTLLGATTLVAAWTILVTLGIFSGATQQWLVFAGGAAIGGMALLGSAVDDVARGRRAAGPVAVPSVRAA